MSYTDLKFTDLNDGRRIPRLGFGTFNLQNVEEEIMQAIKIGWRHIDTAKFYQNEEGIGRALKKAMDEGLVKREELFVTTKLWGDDKEDVEAALKTSLKKLQLDYVDLYLIHWPLGLVDEKTLTIKKQIPLHITWKDMEDQVKAGRAKSIGVSNFNVQLLIDLLSYAEIKPAVNEIELHPYNVQEDLVAFCKKLGIEVTAYSPIGGKIPGNPPITYKQLLETSELKELAEKYKKTPAQIVLNWHLSRGYTVIPKTSTVERMKENFDSYSFELSTEDIQKISGLNKNLRVCPGTHDDALARIPMFV